ncbi:MAG: CRTAC1 family protein [Myxococcota bacterium]
MNHRIIAIAALAGCTGSPGASPPSVPVGSDGPTTTPVLSVEDQVADAGFQGADFGHLTRGRAAVAADFDGDGDQDFFLGNPADESYILYNKSTPGKLKFDKGPLLTDGHVSWSGAPGDVDNDGDIDLFVAGGGNEKPDRDLLYRNRLVEDGAFSFDDISQEARIWGAPDPKIGLHEVPSAGAQMVDYDADGLLDIFVSVDMVPISDIPALSENPRLGDNLLWHNLGDQQWEEVSNQVGFDSTDSSQHSVFLDWDRDGDQDLYENNYRGFQHLWRNELAETGVATFTEVTTELSLGDNDLHYPFNAFVASADDFNLDGWEDIMIFVRAFEEDPASPYDGHVLLINVEGRGFVDVADVAGVNSPFVNWEQDTFRDHSGGGAMGSQIGDVNVDGIPDVYVGQGGPAFGTTDIFFLSTGLEELDVPGVGTVVIPKFDNRSELIDYPAPEDASLGIVYPPYPYRAHGIDILDLDGDGVQEIAQRNGGPYLMPDIVQEPGRLFVFTPERPPRWLSIALLGDGVTVNRTAIGTRVAVTVRRDVDGVEWTITRVLHGGNGFSGTNGMDLYYGLADADAIVSVDVDWPDGTSSTIEPPAPNQKITIDRAIVPVRGRD